MQEETISIGDIERIYSILLQSGYILEDLHLSFPQRKHLQEQLIEYMGKTRPSAYSQGIGLIEIEVYRHKVRLIEEANNNLLIPYLSKQVGDSSISLIVRIVPQG